MGQDSNVLLADAAPTDPGTMGRPPAEWEKKLIEPSHPKLKGTPWRITDDHVKGEDQRGSYNCFGYALCSRDYGWRDPVTLFPRPDRMKKIDEFLVKRGWVASPDCKPKKGVRKIAIYCRVDKDDAGKTCEVPTHAAKQLLDDWWESKMGATHRIIHKGADGVSDDSLFTEPCKSDDHYYGKPCKCYEKPLKALLDEAKKLKDEIADAVEARREESDKAKDALDKAKPDEREEAQKEFDKAKESLDEKQKAFAEIEQWISDLEKATITEAP